MGTLLSCLLFVVFLIHLWLITFYSQVIYIYLKLYTERKKKDVYKASGKLKYFTCEQNYIFTKTNVRVAHDRKRCTKHKWWGLRVWQLLGDVELALCSRRKLMLSACKLVTIKWKKLISTPFLTGWRWTNQSWLVNAESCVLSKLSGTS